MARRTGLRLRITLLVVAYMFVLSIAVVYHGNIVNERAEHVVWKSLLHAELQHYLARHREDPGYAWKDSDSVALYGGAGSAPMPAQLAALHPGLHGDVRIDGRTKVALVEMVQGQRIVLTVDITDFEDEERHLTTLMIGSALGGLLVAGLLIAFGLRRLVKPLADMADDIGKLRPDRPGQRIAVGGHASSELVVISGALNDYLARNERFVERERAFIDSASHELRTPVAVIAGASELALGHAGTSDAVRRQLLRIQRTARGVEQLVALLLVLAKDPERLALASDRFRLDELLPGIVEDHRHLLVDKDLALCLAPLPACEVVAPTTIVQAAIGNLLRNAIENSDRGEIAISLDAGAVVTIADPGHGMSPEEIGAVYARMARRGDGPGTDAPAEPAAHTVGIGLDLIARLCEHLGWRLRIEPREPRGTRVTLDLGASRIAPDGARDS